MEEQVEVTSPMDMFKTRDRANKSRRVFLSDPATGKKTDQWIEIVSSLSDRFRESRDEAMQKAARIAELPEAERKEAIRTSQLEMYASLIVGWSFNKVPCTTENVVAFLREAPQVQNLVVNSADENEEFFKNA